MDTAVLGIAIAIGLSFYLLFTRKKTWSDPQLRWLICGVLFATGLLSLLLIADFNRQNRVLYWELCVPLLFYILDRLFRHISFKIQGRDFILWIRGSEEIDDSLGGTNPHVKSSDIVFSLSLLAFIMLTTLVGALLLK